MRQNDMNGGGWSAGVLLAAIYSGAVWLLLYALFAFVPNS